MVCVLRSGEADPAARSPPHLCQPSLSVRQLRICHNAYNGGPSSCCTENLPHLISAVRARGPGSSSDRGRFSGGVIAISIYIYVLQLKNILIWIILSCKSVLIDRRTLPASRVERILTVLVPHPFVTSACLMAGAGIVILAIQSIRVLVPAVEKTASVGIARIGIFDVSQAGR